MKNKKFSKLIIIGSGPAAYTAAIYAARSNIKPVLITGKNYGGQIIKSNNIENWPGKYKPIKGFKLINNMHKQALKFKTKIIIDKIYKVNFKKIPFILKSKQYKYFCSSLIIATGCNPKMLGLKIEKKLYGKSISTCTNCDAYFYKNKNVAIVGGGNNAIEESLVLCKFAKKIFLIHRRNKITADKILIKKFKKQIKKKKIIFYKNYIINKIKKKHNNIKLYIISNINKNYNKKLQVKGLFLAIGTKPNSKLFNKYINLNINKYIIINYNNQKYKSMTNIKGIFAAGDVTNIPYKQAIIASGLGCIAALDAIQYLENL